VVVGGMVKHQIKSEAEVLLDVEGAEEFSSPTCFCACFFFFLLERTMKNVTLSFHFAVLCVHTASHQNNEYHI